MVVMDLVEIDVAAPVLELLAVGRLRDPLEDAAVADRERLAQGERPGADRIVRERRLERRVQDRGRVVVAVLRRRQHRLVQVEADRVLVHRLDRIQAGERRQPAVGRGEVRVDPALDVPDHVIGDELLAVVPEHALAQVEGPGLEIVGRFPALREHRAGDVVGAGDRQILGDMPGLVRHLRPGVGRRVVHLLDFHGDAEGAALLGRGALRQRGVDQVLAENLAGDAVGRGRAHAEQGRGAQELPPIDAARLQLLRQVAECTDALCAHQTWPSPGSLDSLVGLAAIPTLIRGNARSPWRRNRLSCLDSSPSPRAVNQPTARGGGARCAPSRCGRTERAVKIVCEKPTLRRQTAAWRTASARPSEGSRLRQIALQRTPPSPAAAGAVWGL